MADGLLLPEEALLLSLNDETGRFEGAHLHYLLNAAGLAELLLRARVAEEGGSIVVRDRAPTGAAPVDIALDRLLASPKPEPARAWVRHLYRDRDTLVDVLVGGLVRRLILEAREQRYLWIFRRTVYPAADAGPEHDLRAQVLATARGEREADERLAVLLSLLEGGRSLGLALGRDDEKACRERVAAIRAASAVGAPVAGALAAVLRENDAAAASAASAATMSAAVTVVNT
ncbi:MAG: GPP34 family phosphoprotein [Chthonomonadales bacterium]|nr:GPP34 family phosphoprotein [Chthonomonadales bacterium]